MKTYLTGASLFLVLSPLSADSWSIVQSAIFEKDLKMEQTNSNNAIQSINNVELKSTDTLDQSGQTGPSQFVSMSGNDLTLNSGGIAAGNNNIQAVNRIHVGSAINPKQSVNHVKVLRQELSGDSNLQAVNLISGGRVSAPIQNVSADTVQLILNASDSTQAVNAIVSDAVENSSQTVTSATSITLSQALNNIGNKQAINLIDTGMLIGTTTQSISSSTIQPSINNPNSGLSDSFYNATYYTNSTQGAQITQSIAAHTVTAQPSSQTSGQRTINALNAVIAK